MSARTQKSICLSREYAEKDVGVVGTGTGAGVVGTGAGAVGTGAGVVSVGGMNADAVGADAAGMDADAVGAGVAGADAGCVSVSSELLGKHAFTINFGRTRPCLTSQIGVKIIST